MEEYKIFASENEVYVDADSGKKVYIICLIGGNCIFTIIVIVHNLK